MLRFTANQIFGAIIVPNPNSLLTLWMNAIQHSLEIRPHIVTFYQQCNGVFPMNSNKYQQYIARQPLPSTTRDKNQSKFQSPCQCTHVSTARTGQTLSNLMCSKYSTYIHVNQSKRVDCFWLVKALSCNAASGQNQLTVSDWWRHHGRNESTVLPGTHVRTCTCKSTILYYHHQHYNLQCKL